MKVRRISRENCPEKTFMGKGFYTGGIFYGELSIGRKNMFFPTVFKE